MTTGAFSRNVGKLFSELQLVTDNLLLQIVERLPPLLRGVTCPSGLFIMLSDNVVWGLQGMCVCVCECACESACTIKEPHLPYKTSLDVTQSHAHKEGIGVAKIKIR